MQTESGAPAYFILLARIGFQADQTRVFDEVVAIDLPEIESIG